MPKVSLHKYYKGNTKWNRWSMSVNLQMFSFVEIRTTERGKTRFRRLLVINWWLGLSCEKKIILPSKSKWNSFGQQNNSNIFLPKFQHNLLSIIASDLLLGRKSTNWFHNRRGGCGALVDCDLVCFTLPRKKMIKTIYDHDTTQVPQNPIPTSVSHH